MLIEPVKPLYFPYHFKMDELIFVSKAGFATTAPSSDIRRRTARLGEYLQASIGVIVTYLSPELCKYQRAIAVEQVSSTSIFITYFIDATSD